MKKVLSILLTVVMLMATAALSACNLTPIGPGPDEPDGPTVTPDEITVNLDRNMTAELEIMIPGGNQNERTMIECLLSHSGTNGATYQDGITFEDLFPNVEVNLTYVSVDNYVNAVNNQVLAHTLPDIVWSNSPDFYDLVSSNTFIDLKPYMQASEAQTTVDTYLDGEGNPSKFSYSDDFYTEFFDMGSAKGKCYVAPRSCDSVITFLNTDILKKAGVDLNPATTKVKNGWTWDDFMEVCAKVRTYMDNNGASADYVFDANLTAWLSVLYPMMLSHGADVVDANGEVTLDSQAMRDCLALVKELVQKRYINDSSVATLGSYDNGHSAMLFQSASVSLYANRAALRNKVDLVSFPLITANNTPKIGAGIAGYAISSESKNKELAWAFLQFMLSEYGQQRMALNGLNLASIRKDLAESTEANWRTQYPNVNMDAYTWGSEYKVACPFFERVPLTAKENIDLALKQMFNSASNAAKYNDIDKIIRTAVSDVNDALIEY